MMNRTLYAIKVLGQLVQSSHLDIADDAVECTPDMMASIRFAFEQGFSVSDAVTYAEYSSNDYEEDVGICERARIAAKYTEVK